MACVPTSAPPALASGQNITFTVTPSAGTSNVTQILDPGTQQTQWDARTNTAVYNASAFVDPATCSSGTLRFEWTVTSLSTSQVIADVGITGDTASALHVAVNSIPTGPISISVSIISSVSGLVTTYDLPAKITQSTLTIDMYNTCQQSSMACPAPCACTNANALKSP